jgi:TLD
MASNNNNSNNSPGTVTPDSIGNSEHSEAYRTSVAMSNALVGDLWMESPSSVPRRIRNSDGDTVNRHVISADRLRSILEQQALNEEGEGRSSWVKRGMNWWQRQKEQRQREYLEKLADEQRRKLIDGCSGGEGLMESNSDDHDSCNDIVSDVIGPSKSGLGVSLQLDVKDEQDDLDETFWVPEVKIEPEVVKSFPFCPYLLTKEQRQSIAVLGLPPSQAYCRWKRLYSLARDGDSFDAFLQLVQGYSHTLLVIKTTRDVIFGGYADTEWKSQHQGNPEFFGSAQAFLFRIDSRNEVRVYKWTGSNRYIQFIDHKHSMLAFGGGGDEGAFGLCIENDFQRGSTGTCSTFENEPLCDDENFGIVDVECYGFLTGTF